MDTKELVENYLISMGCGISNKYTYINDGGYDYLKNSEEKEIKLANLNIALKKNMANTVTIKQDIEYAGLVFSKNMREHLLGVVNSGLNNNSIANLGDYIFNSGKNYFCEFVKYIPNKLNINESLLQYLISLSGAAITSLNNNILNVLQKYQIDVSNAHMQAMEYQNQLNQQTTAEIMNAPTYSFGTTNYYPSLTGWGGSAFSTGFTNSSISQGSINGMFSANVATAQMLEGMNISEANSKVITDLCTAMDNIIAKFNNDLLEILILKNKDIFNEDIYNNDSNLEKNPSNIDSLMKIIENIDENEFESIKTIVDYYNIKGFLMEPLAKAISNDMYNYYINNKKCDFDCKNLRLFKYLNGDVEDDINRPVSIWIHNYYFKIIDTKQNHYEKEKEEINNCNYITDKQKEKLNSFIKDENKKERKYKTQNIISLIFSSILVGLLVVCVLHSIRGCKTIEGFSDLFWGTLILGAIVIVPVVLGIIGWFWMSIDQLFIKRK